MEIKVPRAPVSKMKPKEHVQVQEKSRCQVIGEGIPTARCQVIGEGIPTASSDNH